MVPEIAQVLELVEESAYTPGELNLYESYWDQVSREKTLISGKYAKPLIRLSAPSVGKERQYVIPAEAGNHLSISRTKAG